MRLPDYITISKSQRFTGLELLQYPRLLAFVMNNKHLFDYNWITDEEIYKGYDTVIP